MTTVLGMASSVGATPFMIGRMPNACVVVEPGRGNKFIRSATTFVVLYGHAVVMIHSINYIVMIHSINGASNSTLIAVLQKEALEHAFLYSPSLVVLELPL